MSAPALTIREIEPEEFDLVWPIFEEVVREGDAFVHTEETTLEQARAYWSAPPARAFVAESGGRVAGSSMIRPNQPGRGDHVANAGYLVASEFRGPGVARALCLHSLREARRAGFQAMQFNFVVATNASAVHLWTSCGFETIGRLPAAFRHRTLGFVDVLVMYRRLDF